MKCSAADAAKRVKIVIKEEIVRELYAIAGEDAVQTAEPMKNHTTFRGRSGRLFRRSSYRRRNQKNRGSLREKRSRGSSPETADNLVVSDEGYHGVILSVYKNFQGIEVEEETESGRKLEACSYPSAGRQEKPVFPVWSLPPESLEL